MSYPLGHWESIRQLVVEVAQERSVDTLLRKVVDGIMANRCSVPLCGVWLCARHAAEHSRRDEPLAIPLALAVMATRALSGYEDPASLVKRHCASVEGDDGFVGRAAALRAAVQYPTPETWLARPSWARRAGIVGGGAHPILRNGELLGVLAVCVSEPYAGIQHESRFWMRLFTDYIAAALADRRACEEIDMLRRRLQSESASRPRSVPPSPYAAIIGSSAALRKVMEQVELVAPAEAHVLILGESGTGKELVARAIHERSPRRAHPLVCVNCAAVPAELFESEFFGHVKGAFTGALKDRAGRFERADGGSLLLDEVSELPPAMQGKLLRVLQDQEFERVGEDVTRRVSVRIIAASNRDLRAEVHAGRFREDLYYRLNAFPIALPPLRERPEDIAELAAHFIGDFSARWARVAPRLTEAGLRELQSYHWPGNVRELQNVVERAMIVCRSDSLHFDILRLDRVTRLPLRETGAETTVGLVVLTEREQRQKQRSNILAALEMSNGRVFGKGGAAELLGVRPTTLSSRMKALGIERPAPVAARSPDRPVEGIGAQQRPRGMTP